MREFAADRLEDGLLVCFAADGERLALPCPPLTRPEGRRVLVFEAIGAARPYVRVIGALPTKDGGSFVVLPPLEAKANEARRRFDALRSR